MTQPILPGASLGILGSGQLGRMLALVAKRMGYRVVVYSPESLTPAGQVSDVEISAPYEDTDALERFARQVNVVTLEFENIPAIAVETISAHVPVRPGLQVLHITQNRLREKSFLARLGLPIAAFVPVNSKGDLAAGVESLGCPVVLKTAGWGYDGKGQRVISSPENAGAAYEALGEPEAILEKLETLQLEFSVITARNLQGDVVCYPPIENRHADHILDVSLYPAGIPQPMADSAMTMARQLMQALDVVGVLCVEFFVTTDGRLLINELAPRPHNSGHLTIEAAATSQFEQQLRAVCGLPLGSVEMRQSASMANLLGDLWENGEPDWATLLAEPGINLHLYGKAEARPGRKMGHVTALADTPESAAKQVARARDGLTAKYRQPV